MLLLGVDEALDLLFADGIFKFSIDRCCGLLPDFLVGFSDDQALFLQHMKQLGVQVVAIITIKLKKRRTDLRTPRFRYAGSP